MKSWLTGLTIDCSAAVRHDKAGVHFLDCPGRREAAIGHSRQIKHVPELENQADSSSGSFAIFTAIRRACI
jgi:hypothetical protein